MFLQKTRRNSETASVECSRPVGYVLYPKHHDTNSAPSGIIQDQKEITRTEPSSHGLGRHLCAGSMGGKVECWNAVSGTCATCFPTKIHDSDGPRDKLFEPQLYLQSIAGDGTVKSVLLGSSIASQDESRDPRKVPEISLLTSLWRFPASNRRFGCK